MRGRTKSMLNIREILAENLKEKRRKLGLTQEKLAEKANMSLQYLALLELGRKFPSGDMLDRLAIALDVETYELLTPAPCADNELKILRNDIICEIKALNEALAKDIIKRLLQN